MEMNPNTGSIIAGGKTADTTLTGGSNRYWAFAISVTSAGTIEWGRRYCSSENEVTAIRYFSDYTGAVLVMGGTNYIFITRIFFYTPSGG